MKPIISRISDIQGDSDKSPLANQQVTIEAVVTGHTRHGFFVQETQLSTRADSSNALFVYFPNTRQPENGCFFRISGKIVDFRRHDDDRYYTQIHPTQVDLIDKNGPSIPATLLTATTIAEALHDLPCFLNSLEGMLVALEPGATFVQASNPFGDYVVSPLVDNDNTLWEAHRNDTGGLVFNSETSNLWLPSFRIIHYENAPKLNVGAKLLSPVTGPLNYRKGSYQIAVNHAIDIEPKSYHFQACSTKPSNNSMTVLTLNCFNLDVKIEQADKVLNPNTDIDDDVGDRRFKLLAQDIVERAHCPDIIALQEIQDNDGAEHSTTVNASKTYQLLIEEIASLGNAHYKWCDIAPENNKDGGQPNGNIRNGYLYNANKIALEENSLIRLGESSAAFIDSRKPLVARFKQLSNGQTITLVNVHLCSKRHQRSRFAPIEPGFDPKLEQRVAQCQLIADYLDGLDQNMEPYYLTGDFNDVIDSEPLTVLLGKKNQRRNLVESLTPLERYDYNHRGQLQVLMHGLCPKSLAEKALTQFEILHGNELTGVRPGSMGQKASDHAYVLARLSTAD